MKITYEICLFNPNEKLERCIRGKVNSLLKNYYLAYYSQLTDDSVTLKRIDGSTFTHRVSYYCSKWCNAGYCVYNGSFFLDAPEEDESYGILIGTSDVSPTPDDYKLGSQFSCWCSAVNISDVYEEAGSLSLDISRLFLNDNVDTIVKEFGLVARAKADDTTYPVLILRDVVSPIDFPVDYSLSIKLKFSF
ncbi:MAG: hypothetical protein DRP01_01300 [Archaeoglobales archaeon]|nr:MAG: hypothetical protein DRP01_01300 [Archaeoglobales archaeon]